MKERFFSARCPIHGADHFKGEGCEVFNDRLRDQKQRKRACKKSREAAKKQIRNTDP